jgi:hypothetical protein
MAYDLQLRPATPEVAAGVARQRGLEHHAQGDGLLVSLNGDDTQVARVYRALVKLAAEASVKLYDPQVGRPIDLTAPGKYPPGWRPSGAVLGASFKAKVKDLLENHLPLDGFALRDAWTATRPGERMVQGIHFQPGTGVRSGRFSATIYLTFDFRPRVHPSQMTATTRLSDLLQQAGLIREDDPHHGWLPTTPAAALERAFRLVQDAYQRIVRPRLDATRTLEGLVSAYEAGHIEALAAFGHDVVDMADCYRHLGRAEAGWARYEATLDAAQASGDPPRVQWATVERPRARQAFLGP